MNFSQDSKEVKVFKPNTPVNISPALLSQLISTKETDFTRQQLNEKYLEEKIAQLYAQREEETLKKFEDKLNNALLQDSGADDKVLSSNKVFKKVEYLKEKVMMLESRTEPKVNSKIMKAKMEVEECLLANKAKPLNCYEEIQKFKELTL